MTSISIETHIVETMSILKAIWSTFHARVITFHELIDFFTHLITHFVIHKSIFDLRNIISGIADLINIFHAIEMTIFKLTNIGLQIRILGWQQIHNININAAAH